MTIRYCKCATRTNILFAEWVKLQLTRAHTRTPHIYATMLIAQPAKKHIADAVVASVYVKTRYKKHNARRAVMYIWKREAFVLCHKRTTSHNANSFGLIRSKKFSNRFVDFEHCCIRAYTRSTSTVYRPTAYTYFFYYTSRLSCI